MSIKYICDGCGFSADTRVQLRQVEVTIKRDGDDDETYTVDVCVPRCLGHFRNVSDPRRWQRTKEG